MGSVAEETYVFKKHTKYKVFLRSSQLDLNTLIDVAFITYIVIFFGDSSGPASAPLTPLPLTVYMYIYMYIYIYIYVHIH